MTLTHALKIRLFIYFKRKTKRCSLAYSIRFGPDLAFMNLNYRFTYIKPKSGSQTRLFIGHIRLLNKAEFLKKSGKVLGSNTLAGIAYVGNNHSVFMFKVNSYFPVFRSKFKRISN